MTAVIDLVFIILIAFLIILGIVKGFSDTLFNWAAPIISFAAAVLYFRKLSVYFSPFIQNAFLSKAASFLIIFVLGFIVIKIMQIIVGQIFESPVLSQLNRILGGVLGAAEGFLLVGFIIFVMVNQKWFDCSGVASGSFFFEHFAPFFVFENFVPRAA